jgi:apolipoprotein N-acyltransferase
MALGTGLCSALALSGYDLFWIAWVAWVPLLMVVRFATPRQAFGLGFLAGASQTLFALHWIPSTVAFMGKGQALGILLLVILSIIWGCQMGLFSFVVRHLTRRTVDPLRSVLFSDLLFVFGVAGIWIGLEFGFTHIFSDVPWLSFCIGYSQWNHPVLIQLAAVAGVYGVSFVIAAFNAALALLIAQRRPEPLAICAALILCTFAYGAFLCRRAPPAHGESIRVAVLQGNVDPWVKLDSESGDVLARRYLDLNRQASEAGAQLVVWTESAIPWPLEHDDPLVESALAITRPAGATHLIGAPTPSVTEAGKYLNSVVLVLPSGKVTGQYSKLRPLVLAETAMRLPWQKQMVKLHPSRADYVKGATQTVMSSPHGWIGVNICNENFHADLVRAAVKRGASILVNVTNDGWFTSDWPLRQHFPFNIFRAVESRRSMIVANNVGVSAMIDRYGRPHTRASMRTPTCLVGNVTTSNELGFYATHGDLFAGLCTCLSLGLVVWIPMTATHGKGRMTQ